MTEMYSIRPFETIEDFRECVDLQEDTWGRGFSERVAPAILKVSQILGGVSAGAYDAQHALVGFVFGMTGLRNGRLVHWSDMLAVRPKARDSGLGRRLKAYQRARVLELGVDTMHWTFDPLQSRNAYLNLSKLGIVVREYARDMYGQTDSPLHRGIGTDRFIALWDLSNPRVAARLDDSDHVPTRADCADAHTVLLAGKSGRLPEPGEPDVSSQHARLLVTIPSDIAGVMDESTTLALAWREATREVFSHYLSVGYEVRELLRGTDGTSQYLLTQVED